jgi:four helix bundle protein
MLRKIRMSYRRLEIFKIAHELIIDIHHTSLNNLPRFEMYEEGQQIRRSSKSVKSNIVEGYGRRRYKKEFIRFLTYTIASNDETVDHLENLYETKSLKSQEIYSEYAERLDKFGKKLNLFLQSVEKNHLSVK